MLVFVIRHAAAATSGSFARDCERPLTNDGIERMKRVAKGLKKIGVEVQSVFSSPFVRARETAEIVAKEIMAKPQVTECAELAGGRGAKEALGFIAKTNAEQIAVVGHEPQLGDLVSLMVAGNSKTIVDMKKASVSCVECEGKAAAGEGILLWHLVPSVVEALA